MYAFENPDMLKEKSLIFILAKQSVINILLKMSILFLPVSSELFPVSFFLLISVFSHSSIHSVVVASLLLPPGSIQAVRDNGHAHKCQYSCHK